MKKVLYFILLAAETVVGLLMLGLVYSNVGWLACAVILAVTAAVLVPQIRRLKRSVGEEARKKARRRIALAALIPAAVGIVIGGYVIISLLLYFG